MSIKIEVWGDYALFTRPELHVERMSYDIITPSAARGLIESIFWHPGLRYHIDKIYLLAPIECTSPQGFDPTDNGASQDVRFTSVRRNEVDCVISAQKVAQAVKSHSLPEPVYTSQHIQQRASLLLRDVHYVIEAHFDMTDKAAPGDNPGKFQDILRRRLEKGQFFSIPYLGCKEFPAHFREWTFDAVPTMPVTRDLGLMLYDMDYSDPADIKPRFFRAKLENGILDLRNVRCFQ